MFIVLAYDIRDEKRLRRVAKEMENWGLRVQKSVFECNISEKDLQHLKKRLLRLIDQSQDSIRIYFLCASCKPKTECLGVGEYYEEEDIVVV